MQQQGCYDNYLVACKESKPCYMREESEENRGSSALSTGPLGRSVLDQEESPVDESSLCSTSPICSAPLCRQFWKAGNYEDKLASKPTLQKGTGYLHIHPKFLHSNATSHKWAFGAIAELLDNAVDEIQNGATFAVIDKTLNPKDGTSALLIQDDGGGMKPDAMRRCLSFGFSDKKSNLAIGRYGNGFKTSSMRLGADVIVFSRHIEDRKWTQSVGLLSYTFLTQNGYDRIVVPMVDYEFIFETNTWKTLNSEEHHQKNLSLLRRWSPYSTEAELFKQLEDIGCRGTKVMIYNLWCNEDGRMELDFESDPEDIRICEEANKNEKGRMSVSDQHLANRLRFSLRAYLSILYLRVPENFYMLLRGRIIEYHNIANDLKYPEFILYKPQIGGYGEGQVITTIGFLKEAPDVNVHGFNVYHKNRLILPFWHVVSYSDSRGRGVVGVLEANFIEPTHNKQDFEKTPVFQKLEQRLKEMTWEYWDYHCGLLGYQVKKKPRTMTSQSDSGQHNTFFKPVLLGRDSSASSNAEILPSGGANQRPTANSSDFLTNGQHSSHFDSQKGIPSKRKAPDHLLEPEKVRRKLGIQANIMVPNQEILPVTDGTANDFENSEAANLIEENKKLRAKCLEYENRREELNLKVAHLRIELEQAKHEYSHLLAESKVLEITKEEKPG